MAGTTYEPEGDEDGIVTIFGFGQRDNGMLGKWGGTVGVFWDVNDSLLNVQGLLDAVSLSVIKDGRHLGGHLEGHSLGAWRVNNLVRQGFLGSGKLHSLPGFAYPAANTEGACISTDLICGFSGLSWMRVNTRPLDKPADVGFFQSHGYKKYRELW